MILDSISSASDKLRGFCLLVDRTYHDEIHSFFLYHVTNITRNMLSCTGFAFLTFVFQAKFECGISSKNVRLDRTEQVSRQRGRNQDFRPSKQGSDLHSMRSRLIKSNLDMSLHRRAACITRCLILSIVIAFGELLGFFV